MVNKNKKSITHIDLKTIKGPEFLSTLNYPQLKTLAEDIREEIILKTSLYGGHLSSNLGVVEATIALHRVFDFTKDKLIFDVGHQCYTHKILTGRSLNGLRTKNGVSGFQKLNESSYDDYEAGHSSTSISAALGFATVRDLNKEKYNIIAFVGDSSIASGLSFEGLNNLSQSGHKVIIVLNDNDMSISRPVGGIAKFFGRISTSAGYNRSKTAFKRTLEKTRLGFHVYNVTKAFKNQVKHFLVPTTLFDNLGFTYIGPIDGNDIKTLEKSLRRAEKTTKSVIVHIRTLKGKGYEPAECDSAGNWHGVGPFDIKSGKPINVNSGKISWSKCFSNLLIEEMEKHDDLILISPAMIRGCELEEVYSKFKERCIDVGIAEEHAVTLASGISLSGKHPIVSIYSTFMQRAFDEISHDIARMKLNVTFLVDRSGLVGQDGETHQGIYDESFLLSTPNVVVTMPSSKEEAHTLFIASLDHHGPFFIRYPRSFIEINEKDSKCECQFGEWIVDKVSSNKNKALVGVGEYYRKLSDKCILNNVDITLVNSIYLNPMDEKVISDLLDYQTIFIYDAYATEDGFINKLKVKLLNLSYKGNVVSFGVPLSFVKQATIKEQAEEFNLLPEQVYERIK